MPLTILTDSDVRALLLELTRDDIIELQTSLAESLHEYSTGTQETGCCAAYQPPRIQIARKNAQTTLFMPASSKRTVGMKIVSLSEPIGTPSKKGSMSSTTSAGREPSISSDMAGLTLTPSSTLSSQTAASTVSGGSFVPPPSMASQQSTTPKGSLTLLDSVGNPIGFVNAEEMTAFRTALAACMMFNKRHHIHTVTVFGAGKQAFWHIRLAMLLRASEIKHINVINRSFERGSQLLQDLFATGEDSWKTNTKISVLSSEFVEYGRLLKEEVRKADVIFCCTPSLEPLFPAEFLTSNEGRKKGRYISAIGSYKPHMTELHPDIFRQAVEPDHHHHHHKHAKKGGVIIVDSLESCLKEAGEIIQAKLRPEHLVEIGELIMIKKAAYREIEMGGEGEKGLLDWLQRGNVIYKSVGFGLMDLVVGGDLVRLAGERGVGTIIKDF
jgi:ornithine cyclodeaminase/alanine dehydrogenase-like protein (mu-crystallin family)